MRRKKILKKTIKKRGASKPEAGTSRSAEACSPERHAYDPEYDRKMKQYDSTPEPEPRGDSSPSPRPGPSGEAADPPRRERPNRMRLLPNTGRPQRMKLMPTARLVKLMRPTDSDSSDSSDYGPASPTNVSSEGNREANRQSSAGPQSSPSPPRSAGPSGRRISPCVRISARRTLPKTEPRSRVLMTPERYTPPGLPPKEVLSTLDGESSFKIAARNRKLTKRYKRTRATLRRQQKRLKPDSSPSDTSTSYDIADDSSENEDNDDPSEDEQPKRNYNEKS